MDYGGEITKASMVEASAWLSGLHASMPHGLHASVLHS